MENNTVHKILSATEKLFGEQGYNATSMRAVTELAGVNLAAVNYHFGGKEKLFEEMLGARVSELNKLRLDLLKQERERLGDTPMPLETIFSILLHPLERLLIRDGELDISFMKMIARFLTEPSPFIKEMHQKFFHEIKVAFGKEVAKALPNENAEELSWKFYISATCMMGSITQFNSFSNWDNEIDQTERVRALINRIILFIVAGMRADLTQTEWLKELNHHDSF